MAAVLEGVQTVACSVDSEGFTEYRIVYKVQVQYGDGPATARNCPGLPVVGSFWSYGNEVDVFAYRMPDVDVRIHDEKEGEWGQWYLVAHRYSTKSMGNRCLDQNIDEPLLAPPEISGNFQKYHEEITRDRFGNQLVTSSHEQIRGAQVEFDRNRFQLRIVQNVPTSQIDILAAMDNTLNTYPLWGMPARTIKLSVTGITPQYRGRCQVYYKRELDFEVRADGFDRTVRDEGTKFLNGKWNETTRNFELIDINGDLPNPSNPAHFIRAVDFYGNPTRVYLDGSGKPYVPADHGVLQTDCDTCPDGVPFYWTVYGYDRTNPKKFNILEYDGECNWSSSPDQSALTFTLFRGALGWNLSANFDDPALWSAVDPDVNLPGEPKWKCSGSNIMKRVGNRLGGGDVTSNLVRVVPGKPDFGIPSIFIQNYNESDFLILGIPVVL